MNKDTKIYLALAVVIILIIIGIFWIKNNNHIDKKLAQCIANKSELYIQLGCPACKIQEDMFKDSYIYLNVIDCHYQPEKCIDARLTHTPTWIINGEKYQGVQSIEKLKELTGC